MKSLVLAALAASLLFAAGGGAAQASTELLSPTSRGWIDQNGDTNGPIEPLNYIAGNCGLNDCAVGEFRNYFVFDVSGVDEPIGSATLIIPAGSIETEQGSPITYQVTSVAGLTFADLGTGTVYGSGSYTVDDFGLTVSIRLNSAAVSAIESGGAFEIGGRVTSPTVFGPNAPDQFLFGDSNEEDVFLSLTPVPEPATWVMTLVGFGFTALAASLVRRKTQASAPSRT